MMHCQCRPDLTEEVVRDEVRGFYDAKRRAPTPGDLARPLAKRHGPPKCNICTRYSLKGVIDKEMGEINALCDA